MIPKCPELAAEKLEQFRRAGITVTPDETAALLYWAHRVQCPAGTMGYLSEGAPVAVGGRILWPMTLQAHEWLSWCAEHLRGDVASAARGYAAEHGREPGAFDSLYLPRNALSAVLAWKRAFTGTIAELETALDYLADPPRLEAGDEDEDEALPLDLSAVVADVVAATGLPDDYFLRRSGSHFLRVARTAAVLAAQRSDREARIMRPEDDALMQFTLLCREIKRRGNRPPGSPSP